MKKIFNNLNKQKFYQTAGVILLFLLFSFSVFTICVFTSTCAIITSKIPNIHSFLLLTKPKKLQKCLVYRYSDVYITMILWYNKYSKNI